MDNQNTKQFLKFPLYYFVLILVLMDNQNTKANYYKLKKQTVLILVLMDNQNTGYAAAAVKSAIAS